MKLHDKASQTRQRLLFHGLMSLWLRNSGLRPSNSLATTAHFISWNDTIVSYSLLLPFPCPSQKTIAITPVHFISVF